MIAKFDADELKRVTPERMCEWLESMGCEIAQEANGWRVYQHELDFIDVCMVQMNDYPRRVGDFLREASELLGDVTPLDVLDMLLHQPTRTQQLALWQELQRQSDALHLTADPTSPRVSLHNLLDAYKNHSAGLHRLFLIACSFLLATR